MMPNCARAACLVFALLMGSSPAFAQQVFEVTGERALGMAGAFVAVANDATAVHWNPAGLAAGGPAGMTIGWYRFQFGDQDAPPLVGPVRRNSNLTSLGTWPLGISYGQFRSTWLAGASEDPDGPIYVESLRTSQFGVTILQSIAQGLVAGTTIKYVRGSVVSALAAEDTVEGALKQLDHTEVRGKGVLDLDLGLMADMDVVRVGLVVKNLRAPSFGEIADSANTLPRQARLGVAVIPTHGLTLAMDLDLKTVGLREGLRRMFAVGGEARLGSRLAVRSGVRWNLEQEGNRQPIGAIGMSVGLRPGFWLDGHYSQGHRDEEREFGVAIRAGY